jgi:hypothetical protein
MAKVNYSESEASRSTQECILTGIVIEVLQAEHDSHLSCLGGTARRGSPRGPCDSAANERIEHEVTFDAKLARKLCHKIQYERTESARSRYPLVALFARMLNAC